MRRKLASERRACRLVGLSRSVARYRRRRGDEKLRGRLKELAREYPRYGYLLLHGLLSNEGLVVNRKRTYRLYQEEGLQVRRQRRKKLSRPRTTLPAPTAPAQRWSMDFVSDQLACGRRFRVLNIIDDYSRGCPRLWCATTAASSPARRCFYGQGGPVSSCISSNRASRCRMPTWKASTDASEMAA